MKFNLNYKFGFYFIILVLLIIGIYISYNYQTQQTYNKGYQAGAYYIIGQMTCSNEENYTLYKIEGIENRLIVSDRPCNPIPCPQEHSVYQLNYCMVCEE